MGGCKYTCMHELDLFSLSNCISTFVDILCQDDHFRRKVCVCVCACMCRRVFVCVMCR